MGKKVEERYLSTTFVDIPDFGLKEAGEKCGPGCGFGFSGDIFETKADYQGHGISVTPPEKIAESENKFLTQYR